MNSRLGFLCQKQGWLCKYCNRAMSRASDGPTRATIDEVHPRSKGGRRTLDNQVAACKVCNNLKGSMLLEEFQQFMLRPEYQVKVLASNAERRAARKERKRRAKEAMAGLPNDKKRTLPKPPPDLGQIFASPLAAFFPANQAVTG